jgi:hypothetical protein
MRYQEYERRRRALEQQLQADLDLVRAAYGVKFRSLEALWLASADEETSKAAPPSETVPAASEPVHEQVIPEEAVPIETVSPPEAPPPPPVLAVPEPPRKPGRGETLSDFEDALPGLPEFFEKEDVYRALGYRPPRATMYRALLELLGDKKIAIQDHSGGGKRTRYRKLV